MFCLQVQCTKEKGAAAAWGVSRPLLTLIPLRISLIIFMRSSLFFMFLTYKQKSQRSPKPDSSSPLEIHPGCYREGKSGLQSPEKPSHKAGPWLPGALDNLGKNSTLVQARALFYGW